MPNTIADRSDNPFTTPPLVAAREIAEFERVWGAVRARDEAISAENLAGLSADERLALIGTHSAFYELTETAEAEDIEAVVQLFGETEELPNATLGRIDMQGDWGAARQFERYLFSVMSNLYDAGYKDIRFIPPDSPEANRIFTVPAGLTNQRGYVALRSKRDYMVAEAKGKPRIVLDKAAMFALDIKQLGEVNTEAAKEIRLIVAATMFRACDWQAIDVGLRNDQEELNDDDRLNIMLAERGQTLAGSRYTYPFEAALEDAQRLVGIMRRYGMTVDELYERLYAFEYPMRMYDPAGQAFIERAVNEQNSDLLTPAITSYYLHR